ncbi:MAG TPA: carboxypeptidase-like regulatory domain-containing protein [Candidatus Eisenbacteria bacterium]|nr:carboxypeptidase-like regulatory domain-containing protein [Candidatus Eisenbacteria bacterium]
MSRRSLPALLLCIAVSASLLRAQTTTTGELAGTVTDPSGAVLTSASVTLTNVATGAKQTAQANSTGAYRFPLVQPGSYRVTATSTGFRSIDESVEIGLRADASPRLIQS